MSGLVYLLSSMPIPLDYKAAQSAFGCGILRTKRTQLSIEALAFFLGPHDVMSYLRQAQIELAGVAVERNIKESGVCEINLVQIAVTEVYARELGAAEASLSQVYPLKDGVAYFRLRQVNPA